MLQHAFMILAALAFIACGVVAFVGHRRLQKETSKNYDVVVVGVRALCDVRHDDPCSYPDCACSRWDTADMRRESVAVIGAVDKFRGPSVVSAKDEAKVAKIKAAIG